MQNDSLKMDIERSLVGVNVANNVVNNVAVNDVAAKNVANMLQKPTEDVTVTVEAVKDNRHGNNQANNQGHNHGNNQANNHGNNHGNNYANNVANGNDSNIIDAAAVKNVRNLTSSSPPSPNPMTILIKDVQTVKLTNYGTAKNGPELKDAEVGNGVATRRDFHVTEIDESTNRAIRRNHGNNNNNNMEHSNGGTGRRESFTLAPAKSLVLNVAEKDASHPPTSYFESIVHLFKGNIGPGLFAMGDAFKNGGLVVAPLLTIAIALVSIHCQHILINCSNRMRVIQKLDYNADYADTVEQCFENGPPKLQSWSKTMRIVVNIFICVTQLGFCCIYFVFISTNAKQILASYNIFIDVHLIMLMAFVPILLSSLITNLKWLTPVSLIANLCMIFGLAITLYYALREGLPNVEQRQLYTNPPQLALFFGTAIFAFEGIALVLPLKNAMKNPDNFEHPLGVLNVGMFFVSCMFIFAGFVGYMKWGEGVGGSLTLNLGDTVLAQCVKVIVSTGVLLGYPLQFFIAVQIMWPNVKECFGVQNRPFTGELIFRTVLVLVTLGIAELVPALSLFISLIGSLCSTALALVFPPLIELLIKKDNGESPDRFMYVKNISIVMLALLGFSTGTYESLSQIIRHFGETDL